MTVNHPYKSRCHNTAPMLHATSTQTVKGNAPCHSRLAEECKGNVNNDFRTLTRANYEADVKEKHIDLE